MQITDNELVKRICLRDENAFGELIDRYGGLIKSIVRFHLKSISMWQDDCINDILMSIWQNAKSYDSTKSSLKNWIGAVAKYRCIDYKRKFCSDITFCELNETVCDNTALSYELRNELECEIDSLLSALSEEDRDIFIRRFIYGQTIREIAVSTANSDACIYTRISRGRKLIKKKFGHMTSVHNK